MLPTTEARLRLRLLRLGLMAENSAADLTDKTGAELTSAVIDLIGRTASGIEDSIQSLQAKRRRDAFIFSALAAVALAALAFVSFVAVQNNKLSKEVRSNSSQIAACTTPGQACFNNTQEQLNEKIAFNIQDTLNHNKEVADLIRDCIDPQSNSTCSRQYYAKIMVIVQDAVNKALAERAKTP